MVVSSHSLIPGFLDLVDIVHHFLEILTDAEIETGFDNFKAKFETDQCHSLMNKSSRNPFKSLSVKASVRAAANLIDQWGVHRVPLVDETGDCVSILSQSRLVQLLSHHIGL
jgi:CBS-domain-containing membrane protein